MALGMPGASQDATPLCEGVGASGRWERAGASVWTEEAPRAAKDSILLTQVSD